MILIKGFLKHKSSKIYIVILIIMLLAISIIFEIAQYYLNLITNIYQKNSYFLVTSSKNIFKDITKINYVENLQKVVLLENNDFSEYNNINNTVFYDPGNSFVIVIPNDDKKDKLKDDQVVLKLSKYVLNNSSQLSSLEGESFSINVNNKKRNLKIHRIYESNFARVIVSYNNFEDLISNSKVFAYTFVLNDYSKQQEIFNYFDTNDTTKINFIQVYDSNTQVNTVEAIKSTINWLSYGYTGTVVIFLILVVIVSYNIIQDELGRMHIERHLGYNKWQIKKFLMLKMLTLNGIVISIYFFIYNLLKLFVKNILGNNVNKFNSNEIYIILFLLLISMLLCVFSKIKEKNKKTRKNF